MKKYKIKPYRSYYHYRRRKWIARRVGIAVALCMVTVMALFMTDKLTFKPRYVGISQESGYLEQEVISYGVHTMPTEVKGIYVPLGKLKELPKLIDMANETEINAMVIDVKTDTGSITFDTHNPLLAKATKSTPPIEDIREVMDRLYRYNIYPIARIVSFKDNTMVNNAPDQMVRYKDGTVYRTPKGEYWLNPYDKRNWDYLLAVAEEAVKVGFKEIQFDYIRFHESMAGKDLDFPDDKTKIEIISEFTKYMYEHLHPYGVIISADVFGTIITSSVDAEIVGQDYAELIKNLDYVCPMIYPSHYGDGSFGIEHPDLDPYNLILRVMQYSNDIVKGIPRVEGRAKVRPWLQDFTATWLKNYQVYGPPQVRAQMDAVYDALGEEWLLWNGAGNYTEGALEKE